VDAVMLRDEQQRADGEIVWSWRRDAGVKLAGDDLAGDGGKKARSPGRSRISRKPSRRECRHVSADLWFLPRALSAARGPWVRPASGIPCALHEFEGDVSAKLGRIPSRERECAPHCHAPRERRRHRMLFETLNLS
jgi:hypothetical protein